MKSYKEMAKEVKKSSVPLGNTNTSERNLALQSICDNLLSNKEAIFTANYKDLERAEKEVLSAPLLARLKFDEAKLSGSVDGILSLITLEDPIGKILLKRQLDEDLVLTKISCPIGVIGMIFESRPDALIQIAALCIKSGNCVILKGGSEASNTNRALFDIIYDAAMKAALPQNCLYLVEKREAIDELLTCNDAIDLIIPRGSNAFVQYIMQHSAIPVMGHADGICHIYVDEDADISLALRIIEDSKLQYSAACNAVETLLVHRKIYDSLLPKISNEIKIKEGDFNQEYLDRILTAKPVDTIDEAIISINKNGSHHTDCIITSDEKKAEYFMNCVDSASVYHNCSTRFADGFRYGFGAEVGISTSKLHARGPVGLEGLVTYKYKLKGNGQIVGDYASGKRHFHFKDLLSK